MFSPRRQPCRPRPPRGLRLATSQGELRSTVGSNVTFMVYLEDVSHIADIFVVGLAAVLAAKRTGMV